MTDQASSTGRNFSSGCPFWNEGSQGQVDCANQHVFDWIWNCLTMNSDEHGKPQQREWNFISFPPAAKKICISRSGFKLNLQPCHEEQQKAWSTQFPKMEKEDVHHWCHFCTLLEDHCSIHKVHVPPIDETRMRADPRGFLVGDHTIRSDVDFSADHQSRLPHSFAQPCHALIKEGTLPAALLFIITHCQNCGCQALTIILCRCNPSLTKFPQDCAVPPQQAQNQPIKDFISHHQFNVRMAGHLNNTPHAFGDKAFQDAFIVRLQQHSELLAPKSKQTKNQ